MYHRALDLAALVQSRSLFLFGARQTGKTTLLRDLFPGARYYDLLAADTYRELSARPELMRKRLRPSDRLVIVDEVQKLPALLDEIHLLIERHRQLRFILTGSSARNLKRGGSNLLAGRAWTTRLHPLVHPEVGGSRLNDRLSNGGLPAILDSDQPAYDLGSYVGTYLQQEILAEGAVRNIERFSRFLPVAGLTSGEQINFTEIGSDCGVPPRQIREYFQILEDTMVGFLLEPYRGTVKRKPVATSKFYLFDVGVSAFLAKRGPVEPGSESYGRSLEHLIFLELRAYLDYRRKDVPLCYWRSLSQIEVDFVIGDKVAIEVKAKPIVSRRDWKPMLALGEEVRLKRKIVVCLESERHTEDDGVEVLPVNDFLRDLWKGAII